MNAAEWRTRMSKPLAAIHHATIQIDTIQRCRVRSSPTTSCNHGEAGRAPVDRAARR